MMPDNEESKIYTLRDISEDLHAAWKVAAAKRRISMKEFLLEALEKMIDEENNERERAD